MKPQTKQKLTWYAIGFISGELFFLITDVVFRWIMLSCLIVLFISCNRKPDFTKEGKNYCIDKTCVRDTTFYDYGYHYGYNPINGKFENHFGYMYNHECLQYRFDTLVCNESSLIYEIDRNK